MKNEELKDENENATTITNRRILLAVQGYGTGTREV